MSCKGKSKASPIPSHSKSPAPRIARAARTSSGSREENLSVAEVLAKYTGGPLEGVFTDGAAEPNPGPGGWGAVYVADNQVIDERWGSEPHTTNNRMELSALINACALVPEGKQAVLYTDSQLCVSTVNEWAKGWQARGWKRKGGEIKNLELVQELYAICQRRPELELRWIAAHSGNRWNEYADALATAYRRKVR
jgi:ribonuclease HI